MSPSTKRAKRMDHWHELKLTHGRRGWKAKKKRIKRIQQVARRVKNKLIDNAVLTP